MSWLALSLVLSIVLTIVLNVALRAFPHASDRLNERLNERLMRPPQERSHVRVFFPWKSMLIASVLLTIALNLLLLIFR